MGHSRPGFPLVVCGCFVTAWVTLDDRYLDIHVFAGYLMGGLLLFRLLWVLSAAILFAFVPSRSAGLKYGAT